MTLIPTQFGSEFVTLEVNDNSRLVIDLGPREYLEIHFNSYEQTKTSSIDKARMTVSQNQINTLLVLALPYLYSICFDGNHSFQ